MSNKAQQAAGAFHTHHSGRTWNPGHPEIDPWMRDVLLALQSTLNTLAEQIDEHGDRLDRIERFLRKR